MSTTPKSAISLLPAVVLALGIAAAGYFASQTISNSKIAINTAEAKGLAERRVSADSVTWSVYFKVTGKSRDELSALYTEAENQQKLIKELLLKEGLTEDEIQLGILDYGNREYRNQEQIVVDESHWVSGSLSVESNNVSLIPKIRLSVNKLIAQGIDITNPSPSYHFTKLNEIKPEMLSEAARNARIAANEFAENAGAKVGRIRSATQGGFIVVDVGENSGDTSKLEKNVRVVTRIEFYLKD